MKKKTSNLPEVIQHYSPVKGNRDIRVLRPRVKGQRGRSYQVESWAYRVIEPMNWSKPDMGISIVPKGVYFLWNGIRNRYEWISAEGYVVGLEKHIVDNVKQFKKVRIPKQLRDKVEWSKPIPLELIHKISKQLTARAKQEGKLAFTPKSPEQLPEDVKKWVDVKTNKALPEPKIESAKEV